MTHMGNRDREARLSVTHQTPVRPRKQSELLGKGNLSPGFSPVGLFAEWSVIIRWEQ